MDQVHSHIAKGLAPDPCVMMIFGSRGDLARRKLWPGLYNLEVDGLLPDAFTILGLSRRDASPDQLLGDIRKDLDEFSRIKPTDEIWDKFAKRINFFAGDFENAGTFTELKTYLENLHRQKNTSGNLLVYLSVPPSAVLPLTQHLYGSGLITPPESHPWTRIIFEKPFGIDLKSARDLQSHLSKILDESQIYRIDHYLAKETVQNILVFRFANSIFETAWNRNAIDHVQITMAEDFDIGARGRFYEEVGVVRDIVQNHLLQVLALIAMEPPLSMDAEPIRDKKVEVFRAIRRMSEADVIRDTVRGQYEGYRQADGVAPGSNVPTYAALKIYVDNWRWEGVPFYIRAGKSLSKRVTEVFIQFRKPPVCLFEEGGICKAEEPQLLSLKIAPTESIGLSFQVKPPGLGIDAELAELRFDYNERFGFDIPEAYERVIFNAIEGDQTLFVRSDAVDAMWEAIAPVLDYWGTNPPPDFPNYKPGSKGPSAADELITRYGRRWWGDV